MKRLFIVRHAKSSWDNLDLRDFDRPLNERGLKDAPAMGTHLRNKGIRPDLMISSPAVRALATCRAIAKTLGYPEETIKVEKKLYHASDDQIMNALKESVKNSDASIVVIVGHNPGLTYFSNRLLDDSIDNIPTCGVVTGNLSIDSWQELSWNCGERESFETPKDL